MLVTIRCNFFFSTFLYLFIRSSIACTVLLPATHPDYHWQTNFASFIANLRYIWFTFTQALDLHSYTLDLHSYTLDLHSYTLELCIYAQPICIIAHLNCIYTHFIYNYKHPIRIHKCTCCFRLNSNQSSILTFKTHSKHNHSVIFFFTTSKTNSQNNKMCKRWNSNCNSPTAWISIAKARTLKAA